MPIEFLWNFQLTRFRFYWQFRFLDHSLPCLAFNGLLIRRPNVLAELTIWLSPHHRQSTNTDLIIDWSRINPLTERVKLHGSHIKVEITPEHFVLHPRAQVRVLSVVQTDDRIGQVPRGRGPQGGISGGNRSVEFEAVDFNVLDLNLNASTVQLKTDSVTS